jgi:hypothetical protein
MMIQTYHRLQANALIWLVTMPLLLADDAAMLALMFC